MGTAGSLGQRVRVKRGRYAGTVGKITCVESPWYLEATVSWTTKGGRNVSRIAWGSAFDFEWLDRKPKEGEPCNG
jgi:hypothetical protein